MKHLSARLFTIVLALLLAAGWSSVLSQIKPDRLLVPCAENSLPGRPTLTQRQSLPANVPQDATNGQTNPPVKCQPAVNQKEITIRIEGLVNVSGSDLLKELKASHQKSLQDLSTSEPETIEKVSHLIKDLLVARGYRHAIVSAQAGQLSRKSDTVVFDVSEGPRPVIAEFRFEGSRVFPSSQMAAKVRECMLGYERDFYDTEVFEYCVRKLEDFVRSKGYLQAHFGEPKVDEADAGLIVTLQVDEGVLYRVGEIAIEGARLMPANELQATIPIAKGEIANGEKLSRWLFEDLKRIYGERGYIQYSPDVTPEFKRTQDGSEGIVDLRITIDEGQQFKIRQIKFAGHDLPENLETFLLVHSGGVFNQTLYEQSIDRLNETGQFAQIDKNKDVDFQTDDEESFVSLVIKLKRTDH